MPWQRLREWIEHRRVPTTPLPHQISHSAAYAMITQARIVTPIVLSAPASLLYVDNIEKRCQGNIAGKWCSAVNAQESRNNPDDGINSPRKMRDHAPPQRNATWVIEVPTWLCSGASAPPRRSLPPASFPLAFHSPCDERQSALSWCVPTGAYYSQRKSGVNPRYILLGRRFKTRTRRQG